MVVVYDEWQPFVLVWRYGRELPCLAFVTVEDVVVVRAKP
jgi:hypothetical protein